MFTIIAIGTAETNKAKRNMFFLKEKYPINKLSVSKLISERIPEHA